MAATRWGLARGLGYRALGPARAGAWTRLRARLLARRLVRDCLPWLGAGRYLDVGCGSGSALGVARSLGWRVSGIERDAAAAAKARRFSDAVYTGDVLSAPCPRGEFDVVTAFHVLEHVPDPVAVVRRMLEWLAPGGLLVIEVPNAGGLGAALFGAAWSGLELPRHLSQFTPESLARAVALAGGRVAWERHRAAPRHYLRSLHSAASDRGWERLARLTRLRLSRGALKLFLEIALPLAGRLRRGEVVRIGVVHG